jgi:hypothetical protein
MEIHEQAFAQCGRIESLYIPASLTVLSRSALCDMDSLKSLTFEPGSRLRAISSGAFANCSSLESICLPASVEDLDNGSLADLSKLSTLTFESGSRLRIIWGQVFCRSPSLKSIFLPASVSRLNGFSFIKSSLEEIIVDEANPHYYVSGPFLIAFDGMKLIHYFGTAVNIVINAESESASESAIVLKDGAKWAAIDRWAFGENSTLKSICIPASVEILEKCCFLGCSSLSGLTFELGSRLTRICESAFAYCSSLVSICIPVQVEEIQSECFRECHSLTNVVFEAGSRLVRLCKIFQDCYSLRMLVIPAQLVVVEFGELSICESLRELIFETPSNLKRLELPTSDFGCLCIPDSVKVVYGRIGSIGGQGRILQFGRDSNLNSVNFHRASADSIVHDPGNMVFIRLSEGLLRRFRRKLATL